MRQLTRQIPVLFISLCLLLFPATNAVPQEQHYAGMEGVNAAQTVFDFRVGDPEIALSHLNLIHAMMEDPAMTRADQQPAIVIVFIGPSVNLISGDRHSAISEKISAMRADGVRFEVCMTTAHALDIPANAILRDVIQVDNGWISLIGYQHQGFSMIADF